MNDFISHIVHRHINPGNAIMPRLPGRFESFNPIQQTPSEVNPIESDAIEISDLDQKNIDIEKPLIDTGVSDSLEDISSDRPTLNLQKNNDVRPLVSVPEKKNKSLDQPAVSSENTFSKASINVESEKVNDDFSSVTEKTLVISIEKNSLSNVVMPSFENEKTENNNLITGQPTFTSKQNKGSLENPRSLFIENLQHKTPPVIKVSIGRIEVRAIASSPPAKTAERISVKPNMSLDDYLKKRDNSR